MISEAIRIPRIDELAGRATDEQKETTLTLIGGAPAVDPDSVSQTISRATQWLVDKRGNLIQDNSELWAAIRELRRMICSGGALVTTSSLDPSAKPYQVSDALGNLLDESDTLGMLPDTVLARGNCLSMTARLGIGLKPGGSLNEPIYGSAFLQETRMRLRKMLLGETQQLNVAIIGDSYTQLDTRYTRAVAQTLQTTYGAAGVGYVSFGWAGGGGAGPWTYNGTQPTLIDGNVRGDQVAVAINGAWTCSYNVGANNTPSLSKITSSTPGDFVRWTFPAGQGGGGVTPAKLFYASDGTGVIQYSWNDGNSWSSNVSLTTVGAGNIDLSDPGSGANAGQIKIISGNVGLCGVFMKSSAPGVCVHKLGGSGSNSSQWAGVTGATWAAQAQALNPQLVMILLATNDQGSNISPAASAANIGTIVANIRSVLPYSDILVMTPAENQRTNNPYKMSAYAQSHREYAVANRCTHLDFQDYFGSDANFAFAYSYANTARQWYASDLIHPDPQTGGRVMADIIIRLLTLCI